MNKKIKTIVSIFAFALFIVIAIFMYNILSKKISTQNDMDITQNKDEISQSDQDVEKEKTKAPDFTVLDADGNTVKLSDMFGKPIVLNFWASWCLACKSEMPEFNKVYKETGDDVTFMMIDLVDGQQETKEKGEQYIKKQDFSFPVYFDIKQDAADTYGIVSLPTTIFIDKDGYIITGAEGAIDAKTLKNGIDLIK
ncbi:MULTISPECIES: TlpA family protein disulfide reductase [Tissierellales]|jgi:thiol-disulfide isomerase/thioredoxin|uniref:TlpA family protein disulfide reductase n=1 Tax=Acidilutibacter cellobiosedens TaxID=2507161 RepID=A0A410Q882_9FIRM|nr:MULTISPECIES: TlpA disulfide reductase family protein [Tissierellales]MBE6083288.1 TlpA family protein disulfide reductase [Tissierellaceae bacterium]QAT60189.1 TlpA family protein disulfide reductase [Acidilutibacter cellobiosedens]SCL92551.1 Thiol-disulfide oxidoreductase ResA [Sporanaerobacter sp. PP17-6a]